MDLPAALKEVPSSDIDPYSYEYLADPNPYYETLRELGPVVYLRKYNVWAVSRYEDVTEVLKDATTFCSSGGASIKNYFKEKPWRTPSLILEADPPLHTRTRAILTRILSPVAISKLKAEFVAEADRLISRIVSRGNFDAVKDIGEVFPIKVFPDALGLPEEGRERLVEYGGLVVSGFGPRRLSVGEQERAASVIQWVDENCQQDKLTPGGFGWKVYEAIETGELSREEAPLLVRSFLSAGLDTSIRGISQVLHCLAVYPAQFLQLLESPNLARAAFEEMLRFNSPAQTLWRTTTCDVELRGCPIPKHEKVMVLLGAANRDPRRWLNPDEYDITRRHVGHVGLGFGIHGCVGQAIARMEGEAIVGALCRHGVTSIELDGEPIRGEGLNRRAFNHLPMKVRKGLATARH
jgi:cytochrome P450